MLKMIDTATPITAEVADRLTSDGYRGVGRYVEPAQWGGRTAWERITKKEAQLISDRNLYIWSYFQLLKEQASAKIGIEESANRGAAYGKLFLQSAKEIGQPDGTSISPAIDFDAQPKDYDAIEVFLRAFNKEIPGYVMGCYGPRRVIVEMVRRGACIFTVQACAWSDGQTYFGCNVHQVTGDKPYGGITVDFCEASGFDYMWRLPPVIAALKAGDTVMIKPGAKQYSGGGLNSVVFGRPHIIRTLTGDKALLTFNGTVVAYVNIKDLTKC